MLLSYLLSIIICFHLAYLSAAAELKAELTASAAAPDDVRLLLYIDADPGPPPGAEPKLESEDIERGAEADRTTVRRFYKLQKKNYLLIRQVNL